MAIPNKDTLYFEIEKIETKIVSIQYVRANRNFRTNFSKVLTFFCVVLLKYIFPNNVPSIHTVAHVGITNNHQMRTTRKKCSRHQQKMSTTYGLDK